MSLILEAEKAGEFDDELESIAVSNGKVVQATRINGEPLPNVPQVNYGYDSDPGDGIRKAEYENVNGKDGESDNDSVRL